MLQPVAAWNCPKDTSMDRFHHLTGPPADPLDVSHVTYLPYINCIPTDVRAVNEILKQENSQADNLPLEFADLVLDCAVCKLPSNYG